MGENSTPGAALCDPAYIREILGRNGFRFSRAYGQNFLTDPHIPEAIAEQAGLGPSHGVLEVGPGLGALTWALARRAGRVAAVEVDNTLLPVLAETLAGLDNVTVVPGDILKTDLAALVEAHFPGLTPVVCANLPYNITAPALSRLLESGLFESLTVMLQREVAQRLLARPGTPAYGAFTVYVGTKAGAEILFDVPPHCFTPRPKVTSSVVKLTARPYPLRAPALFSRVVRAAFGQRRKTLLNALTAAFPVPKQALAAALADCGIPPLARGETLDIATFDALSARLGAL
ncbi:MAG: 16S rRNA (adenine(1518)-N(6)/adenine(1519)-N(6))-dimethyltransferase RsmA [Oscillospiraceae bacterium]|jgi:16S rRNA (adenine1518-N6/adenine1519-N6)-dimethyltransferase|nr:16S rRNA (adenine(1518)-N(6)/adenine(1519)-N(6))-dimethyltransferase RsmA [Oscillospiraceae bacterium]